MNHVPDAPGVFVLLLRYPYLGLVLILFMLAVLLWVLLPSQRRPMLLSGLLSMPYGAASIVFVPEYWAPERVVDGIVGLEDLGFSLANGLLAWAIVTGSRATPWALHVRLSRLSARFVGCTATGVALSLGLWCLGLSVMTAALASIAGLGLFILWINRSLWRMAVLGALGFAGPTI